MTERAMTQVV
jgi:hypothetical protein